MIKILLFFLLIFQSSFLFARAERAFARSVRGQLMGGAYTTLADDDYTLFYNPAILARHRDFSFYPINPSLSGSNPLQSADEVDAFSSGEIDEIVDKGLGFPVHLGFDYSPGFKLGQFGLSVINHSQTNLQVQNAVNPTLEIDYRFDKGFIAGYGHKLSGNFDQDKGTGEQLSIGVSFKYINREAINDNFLILGTSVLDAVSQSDIDAMLAGLGKVNGQGWGGDLGIDYVKGGGKGIFRFGIAALDVYTKLQTEKNDNDKEVQEQPLQLNMGTSYTQKLATGIEFTTALDIRGLERQQDFMQRVALGFELRLTPAISLMAGVNAVDNYSYGANLNIGLINIYAGLYTAETGERLGQQESDRVALYVSLFDFTFNP